MERLWADARVAGLIVDDGYPLPTVDQDQMTRETMLPISRVSRIEPFIVELRESAASYAELEDAFTARAEQALSDGAVAFKSVIAYRTGLDVRRWSDDECEQGFRAWRASDWAETRDHAKPMRDMLLRRTLVASILPHVYLDTSLSTRLASLAVDNRLELLLGIAPPAKVLYGSDESTEPEVIWLSALLARESLERS